MGIKQIFEGVPAKFVAYPSPSRSCIAQIYRAREKDELNLVLLCERWERKEHGKAFIDETPNLVCQTGKLLSQMKAKNGLV